MSNFRYLRKFRLLVSACCQIFVAFEIFIPRQIFAFSFAAVWTYSLGKILVPYIIFAAFVILAPLAILATPKTACQVFATSEILASLAQFSPCFDFYSSQIFVPLAILTTPFAAFGQAKFWLLTKFWLSLPLVKFSLLPNFRYLWNFRLLLFAARLVPPASENLTFIAIYAII